MQANKKSDSKPNNVAVKPKPLFITDRWPKLSLSKQEENDIKAAFDVFDKRGDGYVTFDAIRVSLRALDMNPSQKVLRRITEKCITLMDEDNEPSDSDNPSPVKVDFKTFREVIEQAILSRFNKEDIVKAFKMFDQMGKGHINMDDMKRVSEALDLQDVNDEELRMMLTMANEMKVGIVGHDRYNRYPTVKQDAFEAILNLRFPYKFPTREAPKRDD